MHTLDKTSIFDGLSQILAIDPADVRPLFDRLLVKDVPDEELSPAGVVLTAAPSLGGLGKKGLIRIGQVVAAGRGDKYYEWLENGKVHQKPYPCQRCGGRATMKVPCTALHDYDTPVDCGQCRGTGTHHVEMLIQVGDYVIYDRRKEAEIYVNWVRYSLIHEQQAVYAILR